MGSILAIVGAVAGALAALAVIPAAIKAILGRIPPGAQAVMEKGGRYVLDEDSRLSKLCWDGVDNAELYEGRMPLVSWPKKFLRVIYITDQDSLLEEKIIDLIEPDPHNPGKFVRVQYQFVVQITWGVIKSVRHYTNYVARAARVSRNNDLILMGLVVKTCNGELWNVTQIAGATYDQLKDPNFVLEQLQMRCTDELRTKYGSQLRGVSILRLARTSIQVLVDGGKKYVPHDHAPSEESIPGGMNGVTAPAAEAAGIELGVRT